MKKLFAVSFFFIGFLLLTPSSYASICNYSAVNPRVTTAELGICGLTGGNGQNCQPYGFFYSGQCTDTSIIQADALACYNLQKQFDGTSGCKTTCLNATHCVNETTQVCQAAAANNCAAEHRVPRCDGTCLAPVAGYVECPTNTGNSCVLSQGSYVCQQDFGDAAGVQAAGAAGSCAVQGKSLADSCTGACTTCTAPYVAGPNGGACILPLPVAFDTIQQIFVVLYGGTWQALTNLINNITNGTPVTLTEFVGLSSGTTTNATASLTDTPSYGNLGGYDAANNFCKNDTDTDGTGPDKALTGSHVCSPTEIIRTFTTNPSGPIASVTSGQAWLFNGPPGHDSTLSNDCKGWRFGGHTEGGFGRYGSIWYFDTNTALLQYCDTALPFACCGG